MVLRIILAPLIILTILVFGLKLLGLGGFAVIILFLLWIGLLLASVWGLWMAVMGMWLGVLIPFICIPLFYWLGTVGEPFLRWLELPVF
jgi:hypothetical protein